MINHEALTRVYKQNLEESMIEYLAEQKYLTMEEAMEKFNENSDYIKLPTNGEYVDGSFQLSSEDVEEMEAMAEIDMDL